MLCEIEITRKEAVAKLDQSKRSQLGQYFTPQRIADFMAGMFNAEFPSDISILDAGAAVGSLTASLLDRIAKVFHARSVEVTTYELDSMLNQYLEENLSKYRNLFVEKGIEFNINQVLGDFIVSAVPQFVFDKQPLYTHAILNPPYKKINSGSNHRKILRLLEFETVNLYAAFVGVAINLLKKNGELVAIIPRSFCNGNYYIGFRRLIIGQCAIKRMHLFESRTHAFKEDDVLQENIIIHLVKGQQQKEVIVSKSSNSLFEDVSDAVFTFDKIVRPDDPEIFIHLPDNHNLKLHQSKNINNSLKDIGISVSTGPVVDFRSREDIVQEPKVGYVPLIYSVHFNGKEVEWPKESKKPNAIHLNDVTRKMMYPNGFYVVVRRFSPKEEKQRIVARVINPEKLNYDLIGIENHLNVFHEDKHGLTDMLAFGLAAYLNSSLIDNYFRTFNGHTQVNATDLRQLPYPSREALLKLGKWAKKQSSFNRNDIDAQIETYL